MKKQRALWLLVSLCFSFLLSSGSSAFAGGTQALQFGAPVSISGLATQGVGLSVTAEGRQLSGGAETRRLSLRINPADCSLEAAEQGVSLQIKDAVGTGAPGQPELPLIVKRIVLSANSEVIGVSVINGTYLPILNRLAIKPVAQPKALDFSSPGGREVKGEGIGGLARDQEAYSQTTYFPGNIVSFFTAPSGTETVVYLRFNPVQYIPGEESAILVSSLDVEIKYNSGTQSLGSGIPPGSLIICPAHYLRAANALADLHQTKFNLTPLVVTTEYIDSLDYGGTDLPPLADYPDVFCPQGGFSNAALLGQGMVEAGGYNGELARKVASYIQESKILNSTDNGWAYFPELQYIVILGNARDVPPSYYVYSAPSGYYDGRDSWIPTDYFYSLSSYGSIVSNFGVGRISVMNVPYAENLTVSDITGPDLSDYYTVTVSGAAWATDQWASYNIQLQSATYSDTDTYPVIISNTANTLTVDIDPLVAGISSGNVIKIVAGADYLVAKEAKWFDAAFGSYTPETFPRDSSHWFYNVALAGGAPFETWLYWGELDCLSVINKVDTDYDNLSLFNNISTKKYFATDKKDYYRGLDSEKWDDAFTRTDILPLLDGSAENGFVYIVTHGSGKSISFDTDNPNWSGYYSAGAINTDDLLSVSASPSPFNLPIFLSAGCMNGDFDETIWSSGGGFGPSFGEAALLSRAGSIGYIGGARSNYIGTSFSFNEGNLSYNTTLMPELLRNVFLEYHRQGNTLGTISTKAKIDYLGSYYGTSGWTAYAWRTLFQNTLLGDPALFIPVRTAAGSLSENILTDTFTALSPRTKTPSYNDYYLPVYEVSRDGARTISTSFTGNSSLVGGLELKLVDPRWRESEYKQAPWSPGTNYSFSFADREGTAGEEVGVTAGGPSIYFLRVATTDPNTTLYTKEKRIYYEGVNEFVPQGKILVVADDQHDRFRFSSYPWKNADYEEWYERALQTNNYHRLDTNGYFVWHNDNSDGSNATGTASSSGVFGTQNQGRYGEITQDALTAYKSTSKAVVYFTGDDYSTTLFPQDQTYLGTYLNTGGRLFITGQDIGYNIGGTSFYSNDLYATYRQDNIMLYELDGISGNPMTDGLFNININPNYFGGARNQHYPSEIDPLTGAEPILFYNPGSGPGEAIGTSCAGLSVYDGTKALVYLPFGFEGIRDFDDVSRGRKQVMGSIINWLFNPTQTTVFSAAAGDAQVLLSWRTPNAANFQGTQIVFKTGGYPINETDGTVIYQQDGTKNTFYSFLHTPLINDTTYYYAAYWYNTSAGYTLIGQASATPEAGAAITYSVSGTVQDSSSNLMDGVTLTLQSGGNTHSATTISDGTYIFNDIPGGSYTLIASESGWVFEPGQRSFVLSESRTGEDFIGYLAYGVSGTITREVGSAALVGAQVELKYWTGTDTQIVSQDVTDAFGAYTVWGRGAVSPGRQYSVVPRLVGWKFTPTGMLIDIVASDIFGKDFTAKEAKYTISGKVTQGSGPGGLAGVILNLVGIGFSDSKTTDVNGDYLFIDIPAGAYTLVPQKTGWTFQPVQISISELDDDLADQDFSAYLDITFTTTPSGNPNPVIKGTNAVQCTAAAGTVLSSTITYNWTALDGYFQDTSLPGSSLREPVWVADVAMSPFEEYRLIRIQVIASCVNGLPKTAYYFQRVNPVTEPVEPSGGGCFIATAAFGTPLAKEVVTLKRFRDRCLLTRNWGRAFVRFYYRHSPPMAEYIRSRPVYCSIVRGALRPLVWLVKVIS